MFKPPGSRRFGFNWRGFQYGTWAELAAAGVFVSFFAWTGELLRAVEFGSIVGLAFWLCRISADVPTFYMFLVVGTAILNAAGWTFNLFSRPGPYDEIVHASTTTALTAVLGSAAFGPVRANFGPHVWRFLLAIVALGLALGAVWEIVEWCGYAMVAPLAMKGRTDTTSDLVMDLAGASVAAVMVLRTSTDQHLADRTVHRR